MDKLNLPNVPRKRRSTNQLDVVSKRVETERPVDQQVAGELLAGIGDYGSEDVYVLKEKLKFDQKLGREAKGKPPAEYVLREVTTRRRLFCCSCQYKTGCKRYQCGVCYHERCPACLSH